jgi:hypothetical protein
MSTVDTKYRMGVGDSTAAEAVVAAREACGTALAGRIPTADDLLVVFPTVEYDPAELFHTAKDVAGPAHVVGCSSFSSFTGARQVQRGVVAAYVPADGTSIGVASVDGLGTDISSAARDVTQRAFDRAGGEAEHGALMMLSDGLAGDQREVVRGSYEVTGATIPLVGGAAGENQQSFATFQYADGMLMRNGLAAVWINSPRPIGVGVRHGWHPIGDPMIVTRAEGNIVYELDGRPAVEGYLAQRASDPLLANLYGQGEVSFSASLLDQPLGLANASGRFDVRHILARASHDGLVMFGHINEQSVVQVMAGDWPDLVEAAGGAASDALAQATGDSRGALVFSCTGRIAPLGAHLAAETEAVSEAVGGGPLAGFFTYGEFARVTGSTGFHNATVVVLAL